MALKMKGHILYLVCLLYVVLPGFLCLDPPDCDVRYDDPCEGVTASGESLAGMLSFLHNELCGCVYVTGDINILVPSNFPDLDAPLSESNFSFFYHIREVSAYVYLQGIPEVDQISFPNLRIIRGESLISNSGQYALAVFLSDIRNLFMPKLTEITKGNVIFRENIATSVPSTCNILSVNWEDIMPNNSILTTNLNKCTDQYKINCSTSLGCDYCWCNDTKERCCQDLTRDCSDCSNRCRRIVNGAISTETCCNSVCAAGCDGGESNQCRACRLGHVLNGDKCESSCPPRTILQGGNTIVANPDFRFRIEGLCVLPCPRGTFELESVGECVEQCPAGMMSVPSYTGGMECVECDSSYCKECIGGDSEDLPDNCTLILGTLQISNPLPPVTPDEALGKLSSIHTIRGSLSIEKLKFEHFPYLSNLEEIGTDNDEVGSFPCNGGERDRYSIFISENDNLVSIDFSSLQTINGGGISMDRNPNLCIIGNLSLFVNDSSADICLGDDYRGSFNNCTAMNQTCHPQCDVDDGCWVNNSDTHCVTCANFMFNERCVESCENFEELGDLLYADDTKSCMPCDRLCNRSCSGPNATDCSICANDTFVRQGELFKCVERCEVGEYIETVNETVGTKECTMCASECGDDGCTGPGNTLGVCNNCIYASINETDFTQSICYDSMCANGFYPNMSDTRLFEREKMVTNPCLPCREGCKECDGPNNCTVCVSIEGNLPSCAIQRPRVDSSTDGATIGGAVAAVLVVFLIAVVILFVILYKHQKLKTSKNSYHGYDPDELEMLTLEKETLQPPLVPPNAARLTVTPEDTLEFGKELGAGAFGTVYEGYWKPDEENRYHVAIKVLKNTTPAANKELLQEGVVMGSMDHENVVRLYCVCMSKQLMLVSQFVPLGALQDYLKRRKDQLSAKSILQFASQIALGMAYLETKFLVHRDLAARNVLVQSHRKVKITDFGLTRILQSDQDHYKAESSKMPVRWLPPESIRHRVFTHKTDVWGFGVTVWEILTFGARPYQGMKPFEILKQIEGGRRLDQPITCTIELYGILLECWLPEPESRPSFEDLHERLKEMTKDPSRYVLTVQDGNASDYGKLPSNERRENETVYETPFAGDVSLDNSLPSNIHIDPYNEHNGAVPISGKGDSFEKKPPPSAYEVATQGSLTQEQSPRYVKVNIGQNQPFPEFPVNNSVTNASYDYIDEEKLLQQQQQDSNTEQPLYINKSNPSNSQAPSTPNTISGHYETQRNNAGAIVEDFYDVEQSYEQPMDGQTTKNPSFINQTYDSNIGPLGGAGSIPKGAPPTDNYEEPVDSEILKEEMKSLSNPVYEANPNNVVPETYNYEEMDEEPEKRPNTTSFNNATYDSTVTGDNQVPPIGEYETIDEEDLINDGIDNSTYDSSVGIGSLPPGSGGFHNLTYEAAVTNDNQVPPIGEYEVIDDEDLPPAPTDLHNPTYDSGPVPNGLINATYDSGPINPAPNGLINATYDSRPPVANDNVRESQVDGLVNKMYDSRAGVSTDSSNGGLINSTYDSMAGATNGETPPINDYEELDEDDEVLVPETDNYEEVGPELSPGPQKGGVINMTYDSTPFLTKEPSTEDRVASPYEVPVIHNDYELPHDGDPSINIYDAPHS